VDTAGPTACRPGHGAIKPVSYELRGRLHDRWVRFHSLPESKRNADDEEEYAVLIRRHLHGEELPRLLRLVADDVTGGVIITAAEMGWL
jgi:hypothetical protein